MTFKRLNANRLLSLLFLSSVFLLAITKINDTDTWMHMAFGRLIWTLKGIPSTEPFVYTNLGNPFGYTSWLFSVIYYLAYASTSVYGVILLKAATITGVFAILLKDSLRTYNNYVVSIFVSIVMVFLLRYRFVERPETIMMLSLAFSIFSLNAYIPENKKYVYFLPIVHLIWANCHSSINLMIIPFGAVLAGSFLQRLLKNATADSCCTPSPSQLKTISAIFLASFALTFLNPNYSGQYLYGYNMLLNPWYKQEILELQAPTWQSFKWPYLISLSIVLSFILNLKRISFAQLLLSIPFMYLSFVSVRFAYILGIVAIPVLSNNLSSILHRYSLDRYLFTRAATAITAMIIVCYPLLLILNGNVYGHEQTTIGFGIELETIPENALRYMDHRKIYGRIYSNFEWGGYVNWRDFPERSVFVDPRGEIPPNLLDKFTAAISSPPIMNALSRDFQIKAVLIKYPAIADIYREMGDPESDPAFPNPDWALVYWDDSALVYLRRGGEYSDVIARDEYRFVKPIREFSIFAPDTGDPVRLNGIIAELKRCTEQTDSELARYLLMRAYNEKGLYSDAITVGETYQKSASPEGPEIFKQMAAAYEHIGNPGQAIEYYHKALSMNHGDAGVLSGLGKLYLNEGNRKEAVSYFRKALNLDENLVSIYPLLKDIYQKSGDTENAAKVEAMLLGVQKKNRSKSCYKSGMQAYLAGNYMLAIDEFSKSIAYDATNTAALSDLAYAYYDLNQLERAFELHRRALAVNPKYANSYYGLALIYKKRGDLRAARENWGKYLDLEPNGYFSRKAVQEMEKIGRY